jgi:hypothetical protein
MRQANSVQRAVREVLSGIAILGVFLICCVSIRLYLPSSWKFSSSSRLFWPVANDPHPIQRLMGEAPNLCFDLLAKQPANLPFAVKAYTRTRGRNPPPGFDKCFEFAQKHNNIVAKQIFDQIYHDLVLFWGVSAKDLRRRSGSFENRTSARNGIANMTTDQLKGPGRDEMEAWSNMIKEVGYFLLDLDMAIVSSMNAWAQQSFYEFLPSFSSTPSTSHAST